jgi:hypothetical protein
VNDLEEAVLKTVLYADIFSFPLTAAEIHHFLIADRPYALADIQGALESSAALRVHLEQRDGFVACKGRDGLVTTRLERDQAATALLPAALSYGRLLAALPFVRMVGLTGALAMRNPAHVTDDIDYVLVTAPGRVWTARAFAIVLVRLGRLRGVTLCPNYVLSETTLSHAPGNLYIAHEVTQVLPLFGREIYDALRAENPWVADCMPNAMHPFHAVPMSQPGTGLRLLKSALEALLSGWLGDRFEAWEFRRKQAKFAAQMQQREDHAAQIDAERVKGHFNDHGHPVLRQYIERLARYGLNHSSPRDYRSAEMPAAD